MHLLLLLAAPTWLWGRCGTHNSPPASSVMDLAFRRSDDSHVSVDTVHPSLLRSSSLSSPGWYHIQSLSSYVILASSLYLAKPPPRFPVSLSDTLYIRSLLDVYVSHMVSLRVVACPSAHLHCCHFQFLHLGATDWHCLHADCVILFISVFMSPSLCRVLPIDAMHEYMIILLL